MVHGLHILKVQMENIQQYHYIQQVEHCIVHMG
nr:hypothetical protein YSBCXYJI_YSBCXYJI_CDS_0012 [Caudoviricetes sp.]